MKSEDFYAFFSNYTKNLYLPNSRGQAIGLCPFHEDRNPSFSVNIKTGLWICFACGERGNPVTFYAKIHKISNKEAAKELVLKRQEGVSGGRGLVQQLVSEFRRWYKEFHEDCLDLYREMGKRAPAGDDFIHHPDYYQTYYDVWCTLEFFLEIMESRDEERKFHLFKELNNG